MKAGRPTKYQPKFAEQAIDIIGGQGKSICQFARDIGVSRSTVYLWAEENKEFSDSLTLAKDWAEAHWEDKFIGFMADRNANAPLVKLYFANRFKWAEKVDSAEDAPPAAPVQFTRAGH
jgi:DNA-binding XRE family transcriptional regulator